ncbi:unnamed protein product [Cercospora beticola]|nr:unnamed protein product [Cercospora beticola]
MLSARELADATAQLEEYRLQNDKYAKAQTDILDKYRALLTDYQRLQSDHEEARMARDNYKQQVRGQDRDPFVLLLVDGDGYVFNDTLVTNGIEGGANAANMLNEAIKLRLRNLGLEHCRVMVRIYANLVGLSKALAFAKLCGAEKRSIAPFVASFNRSGDLFDFVDAGELKENADFKIRAVFRQFVESTQCKHVFFAACHDVGYVSELQPYMGNRHRITLIRHYATHREFSRLNLSEDDLSGIFRSSPLPGDRTSNGVSSKVAAPQPIERPPVSPHQATPVEKTKTLACAFYQKGNCRYGSGCKFRHEKDTTIPINVSAPANGPAHAKFQMSNLAKSDNDFMTGNLGPVDIHDHASAGTALPDVAALLPREEDLLPDKIALNHDQHRLDPYTPPSTREERAEFEARVAQKKLCNNFQFNGYCLRGDECPYDHSAITPKMLECLKWRPDCSRRGGKSFCKIPWMSHAADLHVAEIVQGYGLTTGQNNVTTPDEDSAAPKHSNGMESESDDEDGRSHGATI